jgi:membrane fusion protein (multidrug efflux system)
VVPNPDGRLRGGLFAELEIAPSVRRTAIVVPRTAIQGAASQASVFVVLGGKATRRAVEIAPFDEARVEIVKGVAAGAVLVAARLDRVSDGAPVTARPDPTSAARTAEVLR